MFARVLIDSPLVQLDHLFDYSVPEELRGLVAPGTRVRVSLGRSRQLLEGFVVETANHSEYADAAVPLAELVSTAPVLRPNILKLAQQVSKRQACNLAEVIKFAIPNRSVAVEKDWLQNHDPAPGKTPKKARLTTSITPVGSAEETWIASLKEQAAAQLAAGFSVIAVVPDARDLNLLRQQLKDSLPCIELNSEQKPSIRYSNFLAAIGSSPKLIFGTRSAIYAPVENLGLIFVLDESDPAHREPSSPYTHTRELALIRQQVDNCSLHFESNSRSPEIQRLLNLGYLEDSSGSGRVPRISIIDSESRIDSVAWATVREALKSGPVLIQVARRGESATLKCSQCLAKARCQKCNGPIWQRSEGMPECRWCSAINLQFKCGECGNSKFRSGLPGSSHTLAKIGRLFPQVSLVEATIDKRVETITDRPQIVVATPGAEPTAASGYRAVVILDAQVTLAKDSLRAPEDTIRVWSKTIAKLGSSGEAVIVGNVGQFTESLSRWDQPAIAQQLLSERTELNFPPAKRICSLTGSPESIERAVQDVSALGVVEILGPVQVWSKATSEQRLILRFSYADGPRVAETLKSVLLKVSAGSRQNSRGRNLRPLKLIMDDPDVL